MPILDMAFWVLAFVAVGACGAFGLRLALAPWHTHLNRTDAVLCVLYVAGAIGTGDVGFITT